MMFVGASFELWVANRKQAPLGSHIFLWPYVADPFLSLDLCLYPGIADRALP